MISESESQNEQETRAAVSLPRDHRLFIIFLIWVMGGGVGLQNVGMFRNYRDVGTCRHSLT